MTCYDYRKITVMREKLSVTNWIRGRVMPLFQAIALTVAFSGCEGFLDVPPPNSKIPAQTVFQDESMAVAAISGVYADMYSNVSFAGGNNQSVVTFAGLSADELINNKADPLYLQFQTNNINPSGTYVQTLWTSMYKSVYEVNAVIEGLDASSSLSILSKTQLKGEMLFVRAFCYFYLVNLFGEVPLALTSDYRINSKLQRSEVSEVYNQIVADLLAAEELLGDAYVRTDRIRPNRAAATALLARVYLYLQDWARAEDKATKVLTQNNLYSLPNDLNKVFLSTSTEAIWQLRPDDTAFYTWEAYYFSVDLGPTFNLLSDSIISSFEPDDARLKNWITSLSLGGNTVYLPYKYKQYTQTTPTDEYSTVLRLAEVYLIRAEARAQQGKLSAAIDDIDEIRERAQIELIVITNPLISKDDLLEVIKQERRLELLVEWGHRWLDLKRWNVASTVLKNKPALTDDDLLYPIPFAEINKNPNLKPQNPGY
jgi:hypothetical protein